MGKDSLSLSEPLSTILYIVETGHGRAQAVLTFLKVVGMRYNYTSYRILRLSGLKECEHAN